MSEIAIIKKGDEKGFTAVYTKYHLKLYRYFLKKVRSDEMALELVQLAFIKLWRFRHTLSEEFSLDTQVFNIARTTLIDFVRHHAAREVQLMQIVAHAGESRHVDPARVYELKDYFNHAIKTLPPVRKKVFILSRLRGMSYKEIAHHLSISINTVEDHLSKAIRHIKAFGSFLG